MYIKLESDRPDLLAYRIGGKITAEEYNKVRQELEQAIAQHGPLRMLVEIGDLRMPELGAVWEDLKFAAKHTGDFKRFAVVGNKDWEKWFVTIVGSLIPVDAKYFELAEVDDAWYWVQGD